MEQFIKHMCLTMYVIFVVGMSKAQQDIDLPDCVATNRDRVIVNQSSTYLSCYANMTINGMNGQNVPSGNDTALCLQCSVAEATTTEKAWWQLDLAQLYAVYYLIIYGRANGPIDQSRNFNVFISNSPVSSTTSWTAMTGYTTTYKGPNNAIARLNISTPVMFRSLKLQKATTDVLTLCEVQIHGKDLPDVIPEIRNTSKVSQSLDYKDCYANRTINGLTGQNGSVNNDVQLCAQCSVAQKSTNKAWWLLDLNQAYVMYYLIIYGRADSNLNQSWNTTLLIGNINNGTETTWNTLDSYSTTNMNLLQTVVRYDLNLPVMLRLLKIEKITDDVLTLCEIEIHVEDINECSSTPCQNGGSCTDGVNMYTCKCMPGYTGSRCEEDINECLSTPCQNGGSCTNGVNMYTCKCTPGYTGSRCEEACVNGTFGGSCLNICHCANNTLCNNVDGSCSDSRCESGWQGNNCSTVCSHGRFGENCSQQCHCFENATCHHVNGTCSDGHCSDGWQGLNCSTVCTYGTFGFNCSSHCHCANNTLCNHVNGTCSDLQCEPGWQGYNCSDVCHNGSFGNNCSEQCHCRKNAFCNHVNGTCSNSQCDDGWQGVSCNTGCAYGTFGSNCSHFCHCANNTLCNHVNGTCSDFQCESGWQEYNCSEVCNNGSFGINCVDKCHCFGNTACHNVNGSCFTGQCENGWEGLSCSVESLAERISQSSPIASIAGGVVGAVVIVIGIAVATVLIIRRRKSPASTGYKNDELDRSFQGKKSFTEQLSNTNLALTDDNEDSPNQVKKGEGGNTDKAAVKICRLWDYIRKHKETDETCFNDEFQSLPKGLVFPHEAAKHCNNAGKNRYREMYAYDHSRVVLRRDTDEETDYINASYIHGFEKVNKFIASQGPTKQMINEFWRMVWQETSNKIVMLTDLVEHGVQKCQPYWSDKDRDQCSFGNINVKVVKTETFLDFCIRHLKVQKLNEKPREIVQYHFRSWPDKDVPDNTWCLVNFWRNIESDAEKTTGPIVVHCSAGVGRTGTFIALDILVTQARMHGYVQPLEIVQNLRKQRVNMVQTKAQYVYLHEAVADALLFGTHFVWANQFTSVYNFLMQRESGSSKTRLEIQYNLVVKSMDDSSVPTVTESEYANVAEYANAAESCAYRPPKTKQHISFQVLDATFLPNYLNKDVYISAVSPNEMSIEQYWRMILEHNIKTVIIPSESNISNDKDICLLGEQSEHSHGNYSIRMIEERKSKFFTEKTVYVTDNTSEDENHSQVKQFRCLTWKDFKNIPDDATSILEMLEAIDKWQPHLTDGQPVLVHCMTGCKRSGLLCVIMNEMQRMKRDGGQVNILESVKLMKRSNIDVVNNFEQYRYCFDALAAHVKQLDVYENI